jgi:hypothetical protein
MYPSSYLIVRAVAEIVLAIIIIALRPKGAGTRFA